MSNNAFLSYRQTGRASQPIQLLPQFNTPCGVTDFALERYPPQLPESSGFGKLAGICVMGVLCVIGAFSVVTEASGHFATHGPKMASGLTEAIGSAVSKAREENERRNQLHLEAKMQLQRRLAEHIHNSAAAQKTTANLPAGRPPTPESQQKPQRARYDPMLMKMAALKSDEGVDNYAVGKLFPDWVAEGGEWDESAVLRDLVVAVSHMANEHSAGAASGATDAAEN